MACYSANDLLALRITLTSRCRRHRLLVWVVATVKHCRYQNNIHKTTVIPGVTMPIPFLPCSKNSTSQHWCLPVAQSMTVKQEILSVSVCLLSEVRRHVSVRASLFLLFRIRTRLKSMLWCSSLLFLAEIQIRVLCISCLYSYSCGVLPPA